MAGNGERRFKASGADIRTKMTGIKKNVLKYFISAPCKRLVCSAAIYYKPEINELKSKIKALKGLLLKKTHVFMAAVKTKYALKKQSAILSMCKICRYHEEDVT